MVALLFVLARWLSGGAVRPHAAGGGIYGERAVAAATKETTGGGAGNGQRGAMPGDEGDDDDTGNDDITGNDDNTGNDDTGNYNEETGDVPEYETDGNDEG